LISFYSGKTIHTFTGSGTFAAPPSFNETIEHLVVGGGGGGAADWGGGGGAGAFVPGTTPLTGPFSHSITIGAGGTYGYGTNAPTGGGTNGDQTVFGTRWWFRSIVPGGSSHILHK
jgi:hypothetical protein